MEFFEVLLILIFIGLPLLEGILKRRRAADQTDPEAGEGPRPPRPAPQRPSRPEPRPAEDEEAAAMVPDDLWELLTGERRRTEGPVQAPSPAEEAPWYGAAEPHDEAGVALEAEPEWEPERWEPAADESVEPDEPEPPVYRRPESLEYVGPEAVSLEAPPPPPEVRHRRFHAKLDAFEPPPRRRPRAASAALRGALADPAGVRQAIVLAEVLGPPKGLRDDAGPGPLAD